MLKFIPHYHTFITKPNGMSNNKIKLFINISQVLRSSGKKYLFSYYLDDGNLHNERIIKIVIFCLFFKIIKKTISYYAWT